MTLSSAAFRDRLAELAAGAAPAQRYLVAFSGGLDSSVLLHALATSAAAAQRPVLALHINHGLQADADSWARHCRAVAEELGVDFLERRVSVDTAAGQGLEAAARDARYQALGAMMQAGDWLLSAHHRDDQAETVLLNLLRGSGLAGLAGIGAMQAFAAGWLVRPLLSFSRDELLDYAAQHGLSWIEDPSNAAQVQDRNFLRHEILPRLASRWPEAASRLQRSSAIASDAAALLDELAAIDALTLRDARDTPQCIVRLHTDALRALPPARQRNVLRYVIRQQGLPTPTAAQLEQVLETLLPARDDAAPLVRWSGVEIRRYRQQLYVLRGELPSTPADIGIIAGARTVQLEGGLGRLRFAADAALGLAPALVERGLELRYRYGGEEFRPVGQSHTRTLKKLLQEAGIVPWMRDRIPLLYADGELVAVADLWLAAAAAQRPGVAVHWENRPPIQ